MNESKMMGLEGDDEAKGGMVVPSERYDLRIVRALRRITRSVDIHSRRLASDHKVTVPQLLCLVKIDEVGPMTLREMSELVYLNASTLVGIVDRLERMELVKRERSVKDRRKVRISLTEEGCELLRRAPSPLQESLMQGLENLPELERATMAMSLERIIGLMDDPDGMGIGEMTRDSSPILESGSTLEKNESREMASGIMPGDQRPGQLENN